MSKFVCNDFLEIDVAPKVYSIRRKTSSVEIVIEVGDMLNCHAENLI